MGKFRFTLSVFIIGVVSACSQGTNVSVPTSPQVDAALKITVLSQQTAIADGFADLTVTVLVEDLLGNKLTNFLPSVEAKNASQGVNFTSCTVTDTNGVSICTFRATLDGTKQVAIGGRIIDITFNEAQTNPATLFAVVPSAESHVLAGADKVNSTVGAIFDSPRQEQGSWTLLTDISIQY